MTLAHIQDSAPDFISLLRNHAPHQLSDEQYQTIGHAHTNKKSMEMLVMALDIRKSTMLMKEAIHFDQYAKTVGGYIEYAEQQVRSQDGWFDKFTGDGFLAFWLVQPSTLTDTLHAVLKLSKNLIDRFNSKVVEELRCNSKNMPRGVGVGIGIDVGPGYIETFAKDISVLGSPVVGAVRMEHLCSQPDDVYCNVYPGHMIVQAQSKFSKLLRVERNVIDTKEYPDGQEIYKLVLL
jgi:class 3 adenylate cyclase